MAHHHSTQIGEVGPPLHAIKTEFGRRLHEALNEKGLTQSALMRQVVELLPETRLARDHISRYVHGKALPRPEILNAICKVLEKEISDLLPWGRGTGLDGAAAQAAPCRWEVDWDAAPGTGGWLKVNMWLPDDALLQVLKIVYGSGVTKGTGASGGKPSVSHNS